MDGIECFDHCVATYFRGRICRAYDYHYGKDHPDESTIPDVINDTCFSDFSFGGGDFGFGNFGGDTEPAAEEEEIKYSNTYTYNPNP